MLDPDEIEAASVLARVSPPDAPPKLEEVIRRVAVLGGFSDRDHHCEPGFKTLRLGPQRTVDFAAGVEFMRGDERLGLCVS